ncbi:dockerin type I domain-containing protein [Desulfatibacillum aliphaticivorans]|uniref:dockerin type I domain-containing protein n=1 Tax=Desulfatibacillum aliphaticivorans TaxID=218208 RepID=UPI000407BBD8|nr:dockerin type I domain-containing protein [Desulfatibacillum aliphaticivorans]
MLVFLCAGFQTALAQEETPPDWRRIRTNSVPYYPEDITVDSTGGVWVTASNGSEDEPGVWNLPSGETRFQYLTDSRANNWLTGVFNNVVEKPNLNEEINYAVQDDDGNVWYALNNRSVLVQKADDSWLTINMVDTSDISYGSDTTNVDSAHTIRLIDNQDGSQDALLIAYRSVIRVDSNFNVTETRRVYENYNNYLIRDAYYDSHGRYWVCDDYGVQFGTTLLNTEFPAYSEAYKNDPDAPPYNPLVITSTIEAITRITEDSLGNMWFANGNYGSSGVYCLTNPDGTNDWAKYNLQTETGSSNQVTCMAAGDNGTMWFGFNQSSGIVTYASGAWSRTTLASLGILTEIVLDMSYHDGTLWFTTYKDSAEPRDNAGVYALTTADSSVISYTYRLDSTSLTSNRINSIAADLSGGVWFAAYDAPSVARLKADGTWVQYATDAMDLLWSRGSGSIPGIGVDSNNIIYMAPNRRAPIAYDINTEQWLDLPAGPAADTYFYNVYVDPKDGKWFLGSERVYYLDADNADWTTYDTTDSTKFSYENVTNALMDAEENMWFSTFYGLCVAKNDPISGTVWIQFESGDGTGYEGGYTDRVFLDGDGVIWNSVNQTYDSAANTWTTQTDLTPLETRPLRFLNGDIPANVDLAGAPEELSGTAQDRMTVDTAGNVYFAGGMFWLQSVNKGIVVCSPVKGDVSRDGRIDLADAVLSMGALSGKTTGVQSAPTDVTGDGKVDQAESLFVLQKVAGLR